MKSWVFFGYLVLVTTLGTLCVARRLPEEDMNATQLIANEGYPFELHEIKTDDGYILGVQRIPAGRHQVAGLSAPRRRAVLLQHGLGGSATNWITNLANESLAFILADAGYDVWLGNSRGNGYSRKHVKYNIHEKQFWDFSWQDMADFDLPAIINYILNENGQSQIYYIGHSQGTLIGFAAFSTNYYIAKKVKLFVALAPVSTVGYITSRIRLLAPYTKEIYDTFKRVGDGSLGTLTWVLKYLKPMCDLPAVEKLFCENILFYLMGPEKGKNMNHTRIPIYIAHSPSGTSMKDIAHFGQMVNSKKMRKFNYGFFGNMIHYGQWWPPVYEVAYMDTKTLLFWSNTDTLADSRDVALLLPQIQHQENVLIDKYGHSDFLWAMNAPGLIYNKIIASFKNNPIY